MRDWAEINNSLINRPIIACVCVYVYACVVRIKKTEWMNFEDLGESLSDCILIIWAGKSHERKAYTRMRVQSTLECCVGLYHRKVRSATEIEKQKLR